jgi:RNA polymerase sigma-70 factor (ECF subfamily)
MPSSEGRTNEEWLAALRGPEQGEALEDLRALLTRGLGYALAGRANVREADIQDCVQDSLLKVLNALDSFRGESQFLTWAQKIAVHTAFTELRRRRWKDVPLEDVTQGAEETDFIPQTLADPKDGPEMQAVQSVMLDALRRIIVEELTEKQRQVLVAVQIHGMPLQEVAERMDTNRNALYKLMHDARQRLKKRMAAEGLSPEEMLGAFE